LEGGAQEGFGHYTTLALLSFNDSIVPVLWGVDDCSGMLQDAGWRQQMTEGLACLL